MKKEKLDEMLRVNHAGEYGAKIIYDGQIAALKLKKDYETIKIIEEMKAQEDKHFEYFDKKIVEKKIRPTIMQPIWKIGGFFLGFSTALLDKKAAMCATTAVEEVIEEHYQNQIDFIEKEEKFLDEKNQEEMRELRQKIKKFQEEEIEHKDIGYEHNAKQISYFKPLSLFIKFTTKTAIAISKRI